MNLDIIYAAVAGSILPTIAAIWVKLSVSELKVTVDGRMGELLEASKAQAAAEATLIEKETHNGDVLHEIAGAAKAKRKAKAKK